MADILVAEPRPRRGSMRVSIVTVALNAAGTIADTLASVAGQSHPDIEHLIVDGGSTDGTLAVVEARGARVARVVSGPDGGIYAAMNRGAALAGGDVIGFLNADDVFADAHAVARLVAALRAAAVPAAFGDVHYVHRRDPDRVVRRYRSRDATPDSLAAGWMPAHPTLYVDRALFDALGGFDTAYPLAADYELCVRLFAVRRAAFARVEGVLVRMRAGGASRPALGTLARRHAEMRRACRAAGLATSDLRLLSRLPAKLLEYLPIIWPDAPGRP